MQLITKTTLDNSHHAQVTVISAFWIVSTSYINKARGNNVGFFQASDTSLKMVNNVKISKEQTCFTSTKTQSTCQLHVQLFKSRETAILHYCHLSINVNTSMFEPRQSFHY